MKQGLIRLANHLDSIGHKDLADRLDFVLRKTAQVDLGTEVDFNEEGVSSSELEPNVSAVEMLAAEEAAIEAAKEEGDEEGFSLEPLLERPISENIEELFEQEAAEAEALADDFVLANNSSQDRIDKLAELMAGEFSNGNLSSFSR